MRAFASTMAMVMCIWAAVAAAEPPPPFADFQARRVKPPKPGAKKRILVQIVAPVRTPAKPAEAVIDAPAVAGTRYGWFWNQVSPGLKDQSAGRLSEALAVLNAAPPDAAVPAPRLIDLQNLAKSYGIEILKATVGTEVSPALTLAIMAVESGGRADAISPAGAQGLMQLMPATAARFGVTDAKLAKDNIRGGVKFLDFLVRKFRGDPIFVLAGYNAGENAVISHDGVPPYAETRDYVPKVLAAYAVAQGLCQTPPHLISDGCVFVTMR